MCNTIRELHVTMDEIKIQTRKDDYILKMMNGVKEKWKENINQVLLKIIFSICDEILMYAERVVIPDSLQKRILKHFHVGHSDMLRMKSLMRSYVYWLKMDQDIQNFV